MEIAVFPLLEGNPYQTLLHSALEREGVRVQAPRALTPIWLWRNRATVGAVHLHWLEYLIRYEKQSRWTRFAPALLTLRLLLALLLARATRVPVIWTLHNLQSWESQHPHCEALLTQTVYRLATDVITHSEYARTRSYETFGKRRDVHVIPHGNYHSAYPPDPDGRRRAGLQRDLRLSQDDFVYLAFGEVRPYKRLPELVAAFRELPGQDLRLIIAGQPVTDALAEELRRSAALDHRVILALERIPDEDVAALHDLADVGVFNYADVFSSGALLLALTFGLPVVAPGTGAASEIAGPPTLTPVKESLLETLAAAQSHDLALARVSASATAAQYPWSRSAHMLKCVYHQS